MPTRLTVGIGDKFVVKDGLDEWARIKEGVVVKIDEIHGTNGYRIFIDPPACIDVERD